MDELDRFLLRKQYSPATAKTYRWILEDFLTCPDFGNLAEIEDIDLYKFIDRPTWEVGGTMRKKALSAIKEYLRYKFDDHHPALSAHVKVRDGKVQRTLTKEQLLELLIFLDQGGEKGARDAAIVGMAVDTGMRVAELARLKTVDIHLADGWVQVLAKGGKWRAGILSPDTVNLIQRYMQFRSPVSGEKHFFLATQKPKSGHRFSAAGIQSVFKRAGKSLGFKVSPHDLRRTYASQVTINGAPQKIGMVGGGWESSKQYLGYVRILQAELIRPYLPMRGILSVGSDY